MAASAAESVRVICRFRPHREQLLRGGGQGGSTVPTTTFSKTRASAGPTPTSATLGANGSHNPATGYKLEYAPDGKSLAYTPSVAAGGVKGRPHQFTFDRVFGPSSTQTDAFDAIARETIADVLKGYNGSIFAYGQTGSGKTHTMFGPKENRGMRGVIPRAADELFNGIADSEELEEVTIKCSFLEIYREVIRDLLQPKNTGLKIRELPSGEVYVQGISDEYVSSSEDIMQLLSVGEKNRSVASTDMNEVSSRSHSVLIVVVNMKLKDGGVRVGKLNLADLAGSERIERTNATGQTLEEAKKINQSLSALGNCIGALTDAKRTHVPFRDSTLTFLLKDSLGGNSKSTVLVCASPEESDCLETLSTLNFAKRVKRIKNSVSVNMKLGVEELMSIVAELRKELTVANKTIVALQKLVRTMQAGGTVPKEMLDALLKPPGAGSGAGAGVEAAAAAAITATALVEEPSVKPEVEEEVEPILMGSPLASSDDFPLDVLDDDAKLHAATAGQEGLLDLSFTRLDDSLPDLEAHMAALPSLPGNGSGLSTPRSGSVVDAPLLPPDDGSTNNSAVASPLTLPNDSFTSLVPALSLAEREQKLTAAQSEIEQLRAQLESHKLASQTREQEWHQERERIHAEHAVAIAAPVSSVPSPQVTPSKMSDADKVLALLSKNERLEKQMAEMKETWTAYLDLILENQKSQEKERLEEEEAAANHSKNARVVKPVRKQGFFSFFNRKSEKPEPEREQVASPVAVRRPLDRSATMRSPITPVPASSPSAASSSSTATSVPVDRKHVRASSALPANTSSLAAASTTGAAGGASRGTFDQAIAIAYLQKRPVGFSITRQWRRRLFVLRPDTLDYYEDSTLVPAPGSESFPVGPSQPQPPATLKQSFRGSIELDAQTTVAPALYSDAPYGFEITSKDKQCKLCAGSEAERAEWIQSLNDIITCRKRGIDPATLVPGSAPPPTAEALLDPEITHANQLLSTALSNLPDPSPPPVSPPAPTADR